MSSAVLLSAESPRSSTVSPIPPTVLPLVATEPFTRTEIVDLIHKFGPRIIMHPREPYGPSSVEFFLAHAMHYIMKDGVCTGAQPVIGEDGQYSKAFTSPESGADFLALKCTFAGRDLVGKSGADLSATPAENDRAFADPIAAGDYESARGYCNVKWWPGGTTTDLQFWFFCAMNGPGEVELLGKRVALSRQGRHQADWEKCTVRVSNVGPSRGNAIGMFMSQHAEAEYAPLGPEEQAVTWSALNGHPCYPRPGLRYTEDHKALCYRYFAVRNETEAGGRSFNCAESFELIHCTYGAGRDGEPIVPVPPPWMLFQGRWGPREDHIVREDAAELVAVLPCVCCCKGAAIGIAAGLVEKTDNGSSSLLGKTRFFGPEHEGASAATQPCPYAFSMSVPAEPLLLAARSAAATYAPAHAFGPLAHIAHPCVYSLSPPGGLWGVCLRPLALEELVCVGVMGKGGPGVWRPSVRGVVTLGDVWMQKGSHLPYAAMWPLDDETKSDDAGGALLAPPTAFSLVVTDPTSGLSFFAAVPPPGYVSLGMVASTSTTPPSPLSQPSPIMCMREEAAAPAYVAQAWAKPVVFAAQNPCRTFKVLPGGYSEGSVPVSDERTAFGLLRTPALTFLSVYT